MDNNYQLQYLPLIFDDLLEKASYIRDNLSNPQAANDLLDTVEEAILERLPVCESFEPYHSIRERKYPYYSRDTKMGGIFHPFWCFFDWIFKTTPYFMGGAGFLKTGHCSIASAFWLPGTFSLKTILTKYRLSHTK